MMRISLDSPALSAVRSWLAGSTNQRMPHSGRSGSRKPTRTTFRAEQLEPRMMLDAGMRALLPDLVAASDTGLSDVDNVTSDRTPVLSGSVRGAATQVRLFIDGRRGPLLPVENGTWTHAVPAEEALGGGRHTIAVRPFSVSGRGGALSQPLTIETMASRPAASTVRLADAADTGTKGDGRTTVSEPTFRGVAPRGRDVILQIDGVAVQRVKSDPVTGRWEARAPRLANGEHEVTAWAVNRAGTRSEATTSTVAIDGGKTLVLGSVDGRTVELTAAHLLGQGVQGAIVTKVHQGTLQKWSGDRNRWTTIPPAEVNPGRLGSVPEFRKILPSDKVRWTPPNRMPGLVNAFDFLPLDVTNGPTAPIPAANTVPGEFPTLTVSDDGGFGSTITWGEPTGGCGCPSALVSLAVTTEDGQTRVYTVPNDSRSLPVLSGGRVLDVELWGATMTGAGPARTYDASRLAELKNQLMITVVGAAASTSLGLKARAQLAHSPTPNQVTTSLPLGGSHAGLAYLQVDAVPDAIEAEQGLPAGTRMIISSDSSKLTPGQLADLEANPIYASYLFPGTVNGAVQPDQLRAHFQAGETLRFAGTVDPRVRAGATIVVEKAQNLGDGSLGPWFQEARIPVGADGSFSQKVAVPHGLYSVRMRLEYRTQPGTTPGATPSTVAPISTPIDLSTSFNAFGITTPPWQVGNNQGFDGNGNYYNSDYDVDTEGTQNSPVPGTPIVYNGISFPIGPVPTNANQVGGTEGPRNFVRATGQTIQVSVDADKSDYLYLAGAASNGDQLSQDITLTFTDGTTETWTQSFHDWASGGPPQPNNPPWPPAYTSAPGANEKMPVKGATTAMLPNANYPYFPQTFSGLQTIDGVALAEGDRVLVKNQNFEQYNGIYVASAGTWSRAKDALTTAELWNASMPVLSGTTNGGKYFWENTDPLTSDYDLTFVEISPPVPTPRPFVGELNLKTEPERVNQLGNLVTTPAHIFGYCRNLHGKQLASITLPNNPNIGILSAVVSKAPVIALDQGFESLVLGTVHLTGVDLVALTIANESNIGAGGGPLSFFFADQPVAGSTTSPPTYSTKQVTVPMGQQTTIAYVAPDDSSQMNFYVQKADGTCIGSTCRTYLTDWNIGGGTNSNEWAANITPTLNSQLKAGQHWTMTIQNAGLGYNGYLSSPSGQGLPGASGGRPAGAQFKLMTANEIRDQPSWARALEKDVGIIVGLSIISVGVAEFVLALTTAEEAGEATVAIVAADDGGSVIEVFVPEVWQTFDGDLAAIVADGEALAEPVIVEAEEIDDLETDILRRAYNKWTYLNGLD
jgi:hypothetical protein